MPAGESGAGLASGTLLGNRFELLAPMGRGGMGTVFRAIDRQTAREVAVKVISGETASFHESERFSREARILAELRHPGIVEYIAHGRTLAGRPFLAMEWLEGEDLGQRLVRGPLDLHDALGLVRTVAQALAVLHRCGVVHRDLKPSNIFLREGRLERATLLDFGIARTIAGTARLTVTGVVIGTPDYMAPEQASGQHDVGPAADIFSLGCVLHECLAGEPPFSGRHVAAVLAKILFQEAPSLRARRPDVPEAVEAALRSMLAKDPERRPADATALLGALARVEDLVTGDDATLAPRVALAHALADVEQRYVSVVIVGGGEQAPTNATLGPEELASRKLERRSLDESLARLGARTAWLADGSIVATLAHTGSANDQAAQAARCALVVHERWPSAAIGLATGRGVLHERLPVGEAIDRAALLLRTPSDSTAGLVLVDDVSAGLLDARFVLEPGDGAFVLMSEQSATREARRLLGKPTPCVGREQELAMLGAVLSTCTDESVARAVLVSGPPGMGKSRLHFEFLRRLPTRGATPLVLSGRADPVGAGSPYGILTEALLAECGAVRAEALSVQQAALRRRLARHLPAADAPRVTEFLAELCGLPFVDEASPSLRAARRDPRLMNDQVSLAFVDLVRAECRARPLLLVLEDLHWGDVLTVKLIDRALRELPDQPWMVLAFARPEVDELLPARWSDVVQEIRLGGLSKKASERLVHEVLGPSVPDETVARVVKQAGGNALHLEELIRAVAEGKGEELPETVLAMLHMRLHQLAPEARRLLRAASIFGATFSRDSVVALSGADKDDARVLLDALIRDEVVEHRRERRFADDDDYCFRHALLRDAAYATLLDADRALGHRLAGAFLEQAGEHDPMVLAEHYRRGGEPERAVPLYARAAEQALLSNDLTSALARVERAIGCGASGEALGVVQGLAASAYFWRDEWAPGYEAAKVALAHLEPGGLRWCKACAHQFVFTSVGLAKHEEFGELVGLFAGTAPAEAARAAFVEAASWLVTMFSLLGQRDATRGFLALMDRVCSAIGGADVMAEGWQAQAHMFHARMLGEDPWLTQAHAERASAAFRSMSDQRNLAFIEAYRGLAQADLGLPEAGEA
ncbi:MAG TPA: protein kinase, partial [Nannocystis sp.]